MRWWWLILFFLNCSDAQPSRRDASVPAEPTGEEEPISEEPIPEDIHQLRHLRQLSLDMLGELPSRHLIEQVKEQHVRVQQVAHQFIYNDQYAQRLSQRLRIAWGLLDSKYRFLSSYGDVDETMATKMADGVLRHVGLMTEQNKHPGFAFMGTQTLLQEDYMNFLGLSGEVVTESAGYFWVSHDQQNADWGALSSPGLLGHFGGHAHESARMRRVLGRVFCLPYETEHDFSALEQQEIFDIEQTQLQNIRCLACHRRHQNLTDALGGMLQSTQPQDWWEVTQEWQGDGFYAGETYRDRHVLNQILLRDPRLQSCGTQAVIASLLGRPLQQKDRELLLKTLKSSSSLGFARSFLSVLTQTIEGVPLFTHEDKKSPHEGGFRVLDRWQWYSLARQFVGQHAPEPPLEISPSLDEAADKEYQMPSGRYLRALKIYVVTLAEKIVELELADSVLPHARRLLTVLPSGAGMSDAAAIRSQIVTIWERMTGLVILEEDPTVDRLMALGDSVVEQSQSVQEQSRRRWVCILAGMMLSYEFIGV